MFTRFQARVVAFFSRPAVQSVVRHMATAAIAAAVPVFVAGGLPALVGAVGVAAVLRAVWAVLRPVVVEEVQSLGDVPQPRRRP